MPIPSLIEVTCTEKEVQLVISIGKQVATHGMSGEFARELGENLFKAGCMVEDTMPEPE